MVLSSIVVTFRGWNRVLSERAVDDQDQTVDSVGSMDCEKKDT